MEPVTFAVVWALLKDALGTTLGKYCAIALAIVALFGVIYGKGRIDEGRVIAAKEQAAHAAEVKAENEAAAKARAALAAAAKKDEQDTAAFQATVDKFAKDREPDSEPIEDHHAVPLGAAPPRHKITARVVPGARSPDADARELRDFRRRATDRGADIAPLE